jgi:ubiquinone biosynthesis protein UbiJ
MALNGQLKKVVDAWPVLAAVGLLMAALLTVYAKGFVGEVAESGLGKTQTIIDMNKEIAANTDDIENHDDDVARIEKKIGDLEAKIDRLIEIMLTAE